MIHLRIKELLEEKGRTKYWLHNQMNIDYHNLSRMMKDETSSIRFENIEKLCAILECTPNDLFKLYQLTMIDSPLCRYDIRENFLIFK